MKTLQEFRRRFIVRILRDEFPLKRIAQDRLAQRLGIVKLGLHFDFKVVDNRKLVFKSFDDRFLLFKRGKSEYKAI